MVCFYMSIFVFVYVFIKILSALTLAQVPSELSAAGAKRGVRLLQLGLAMRLFLLMRIDAHQMRINRINCKKKITFS